MGSTPTRADPEPVRLQKVLAAAGFGSRRRCEQLVAAGRVQVNGRRVTELGTRVRPGVDEVKLDGARVPTAPHLVYLAVHKPAGMLSAMSDARGRSCLGDLVADRSDRLFHVGRLDADSEGLLFLSNDGELAHKLTHPSFGVPKTYLAEVSGPLPRDVGRRLRSGVELDDGVVAVDGFRILGRAGARVLVEVVVHEGRKHVVRRLLAAVGHPVARLVRTAIGPVALGSLPPGRLRHLSAGEVGALYRLVDQPGR
jgi:pseudouridine synthase